MATINRRDGTLALEKYQATQSFLQQAISYLVANVEPEFIEASLANDIKVLQERHDSGKSIFKSLGTSAPAFGMIGTLIGLIQMMASMSDPSQIGPAMALALLTTFYGALLANLVFLPIADKLEIRSRYEVLFRQLILDGILAIILMLSFSETDRQLFKVLSGSLREAFGVQREHRAWDMPKGMNIISTEFKEPKFLADDLAKEIRSAVRMAKGQEANMAQIEEGELSVKVTLPGHVLFDLGSSHLKEEALPILDELRNVIRETPNRIIVTGHTDNLPISTAQFPSNWELSAARAGSVIPHFLE